MKRGKARNLIFEIRHLFYAFPQVSRFPIKYKESGFENYALLQIHNKYDRINTRSKHSVFGECLLVHKINRTYSNIIVKSVCIDDVSSIVVECEFVPSFIHLYHIQFITSLMNIY